MPHSPLELSGETLVDVLFSVVRANPSQTAYIFVKDRGRTEQKMTYWQLFQQARAIAMTLQQKGYQEKCVLLLYPPSLDYIVAFWGCLLAGVTAIPAYPPNFNRPIDRLESIVTDAKPVAAITTDALVGSLVYHFGNHSGLEHIDCISTDLLDVSDEDWVPPAIDADHIAFLQYTSGSTSLPKGVMVSHKNLMQNEQIICEAFGHTQETVVAGWLPLYHDMGLIGNVIQPLCLGRTCVLISPLDFLKKPVLWLEIISKYKVTTSGGPNFAYDLCVRKVKPEDIAKLDLSSWRVAFNGAEPIRATTLQAFSDTFAPAGFDPRAFYPCYGLAEATLFVTGVTHMTGPVIKRFDASALEENRAVPAAEGTMLVGSGRLWGDQKLLIVDPDSGQPLSDNEIGEIWLQSDCVTRGYWQRPAATEETFHAYTHDGLGPFLRTGDLGFLSERELFVTGRTKDLIIIDGRNHYPQDIEHTVERTNDAVRPSGCAAFAVDHENEEQLVVVARVKMQGATVSIEQLRQEIIGAIVETHQIRPHDIVLITQGNIPKTTSGKVQRRLCRKMYLNGHFGSILDSA